jgi:hypothetical protein
MLVYDFDMFVSRCITLVFHSLVYFLMYHVCAHYVVFISYCVMFVSHNVILFLTVSCKYLAMSYLFLSV